MARLTEEELRVRLAEVPGWALETGVLGREWGFGSFPEAMAFVNRVAVMAGELDHHPDFEILYEKMRLRLVSH